MDGVNYYHLFSLSPGATADELKAQYRKLSLTYHPDRGGTTEQMAQLNEAYRVLSSPLLRREYDQKQTAAPTSNADYHYTQPVRRAAPAQPITRSQSHFWSRFAVFAAIGLAIVAYDVMSTMILPRYLTETNVDPATTTLTPSGDLTDEAAAALREAQTPLQYSGSQVTPQSVPTIERTTPQPATDNTNSSQQSTNTTDQNSAWRERARARRSLE